MYSDLAKTVTLIEKKEHVVGVIGLGYVGLPLVRAMCSQDIRTYGFDIDISKINCLLEGQSYITGVSNENISEYMRNDLFHPTNQYEKLSQIDIVILCLPTPLDDKENPDLSYITDTARVMAPYLKNGAIIVLESTTYPGTVEEVLKPIVEQYKSKNITTYYAYSPEREDPGNANFETSTVPKLVAGETPEVLHVIQKFYQQFIKEVVPVSSIRAAESAKLTENIFRAVNIALVNELKVVYDSLGIDIYEVIDAAATKPFGYMPFYPGPGIGGHCIPIDPLYLSWKAEQAGSSAEFIKLAARINQSMADYIIKKLVSNLPGEDLKNKNILILGVAYKKDVADQRESPAFPVMEKLLKAGAKINFHDPYVPSILKNRRHPEFSNLQSIDLSAESLITYDATVLITDHSCVEYGLVEKHSKLIIDTRNVYDVASNIVKA